MAIQGKSSFKVVVVGGSVAGLSLAHALEKANIDYVVLEGRDMIAPQLGASIIMMANGSRILDQLGLYEPLGDIKTSLHHATNWKGSGERILQNNGGKLVEARLGYPFTVMARQKFLQSLFDQLKNKTKIHLKKRVTTVTQATDSIVVRCSDGTEYCGDLVVGADGIHSRVREEMRKHAEQTGQPGLVAKDKSVSITAEYDCVYAIADPIPGFAAGEVHRSYDKDHSSLVFVGNDLSLYWALFSRMDKVYSEQDMPRYAKSKVDSHIQRFAKLKVGCNVTLKDLWARTRSSSFVPLEESQNEVWTYGRFVCLGDAIHKMTPNMGQGGNMAIESTAVLANQLVKMLEGTNENGPTIAEIEQNLKEYSSARQKRANMIVQMSNELTRMEALSSPKWKFRLFYLAPRVSELVADRLSNLMADAPKLDYLPLPQRSICGTMPWTLPEVVLEEAIWRRVVRALPLLLICYAGTKTLGSSIESILPLLRQTSKTSIFVEKENVIQMPSQIFNFGIDKLVKALVAFFIPSILGLNPISRYQAIAFLADLLPLQALMIIESIRRGNAFTAASILPLVFCILYQLKGVGIIMPIYYFMHYIQTPLKNYRSADHRLVNMAYVKTLIPALTTGFVIPSTIMLFAPDPFVRQYAAGIWQLFPLWVSLSHRFFALLVKDTTSEDIVNNVYADLPYLRAAYIYTGVIAGSAYIYLWTFAPYPMLEIFFSGLKEDPDQAVKSIITASARFLRHDQICAFGAGLYWVVLHFRDLKKSGRETKKSWLSFGRGIVLATVGFGPGAVMAAFWSWRDEVLARKMVG